MAQARIREAHNPSPVVAKRIRDLREVDDSQSDTPKVAQEGRVCGERDIHKDLPNLDHDQVTNAAVPLKGELALRDRVRRPEQRGECC